MPVIRISFIIFFLSAFQFSQAQVLDSLLEKNIPGNAIENIYIQYNKQHYYNGETIWIKAYISSEQPIVSSSHTKFQLIDGNGKILSENIYPIFNGVATGNILIPDTLSTDRYFLRAFTDNTVRSPERNQAFLQPLLIINKSYAGDIKYKSYEKRILASWSFHNCPVIRNVQNELFFYVSDQYNIPQAATTLIVNEKFDTLCINYGDETGTGKLIFTPEPNTEYTAVVYTNTDTIKYAIPVVPEGITMTASATSLNNYSINIQQSPQNKQKPKLLIAEMGLNISFKQQLNSEKASLAINLRTDSVESGILRLCVLDENNSAISEKFVLVNNTAKLVSADAKGFQIQKLKDSLAIDLSLLHPDEMQIAGSVSVIDEKLSHLYPQQNILSRMLFSGYFKRTFQFTPVLFEKYDIRSLSILNCLLSAEKATKPSWESLTNSEGDADKTPRVAPVSYISFSAQLYDKENKKVGTKDSALTIIMQTTDSVRKYLSFPISNTGKIEGDGFIFTDSAKFFFQLSNRDIQTGKKLSVDTPGWKSLMTLPLSKASLLNSAPPIELDLAYSKIESNFRSTERERSFIDTGRTLEDVTVKSAITLRQKTKEVNKRYTRGMFTKDSEKTLDLVSDPYPIENMSVIDYIVLKYPSVYNRPTNWEYFMDEGNTTQDDLKQTSLNGIALIKIFQFGIAGRPTIAVYRKKVEDLPDRIIVGLDKFNFSLEGYSQETPFKSNFPLLASQHHKLFGLQWDPYLPFIESKIHFNILNIRDDKAKYTLTIEGFTSGGALIFHKARY
jgi:hypothetical protein